MRVLIVPFFLGALLGCKTTETREFDLCKDHYGKPRTREAAWLVKIEPKYPKDAWDNNIKGYVKLKFFVSSAGNTEKIEILESTPKGLFDEVSVNALKRWKYVPKCNNGILIPEPIETTLSFDGKDS